MKYKFILLLLILSSCVSNVKVVDNDGSVVLKSLNLKVEDVSEKEWKVGKKQDQVISRGVGVKLSIPKISEEDIEKITKRFGADTLLVQIKRKYRGAMIHVGSIAVKFAVNQKIPAHVYFDILYYSAMYRPSYINYVCVPYNNSYKVNRFKKGERYTYSKDISVSLAYEKEYREVVIPNLILSQSITPGRKLVGEYYFSIAFYNKNDKLIKSTFYDYPETLQILKETKVDIKGCAGYDGDGIILHGGEKIKFGRQ